MINKKVKRPIYQKAALSWFLLGAMCFCFFAFSELSTPVTLGIESESLGSGFVVFDSITIFFANLVAFTLFFLTPCIQLARLSKFDSWSELRKYDEIQNKEAQKSIPLGKVITSKVERGGSFSSPTSTIETERGFYRVDGDVGSVDKGVPISKIMNTLYIDLPRKNRKFALK
jgi:hypothetical protein